MAGLIVLTSGTLFAASLGLIPVNVFLAILVYVISATGLFILARLSVWAYAQYADRPLARYLATIGAAVIGLVVGCVAAGIVFGFTQDSPRLIDWWWGR
jgi:p-aminobenzoyl-glutamate transporter AbgT